MSSSASRSLSLSVPVKSPPLVDQGQFSKKKLSSSSKTTEKTHALVVLGNILIGAGVVISLGAIVCAIVVNPFCALGLIVAIALCIIGTHFIDNENSTVEDEGGIERSLKSPQMNPAQPFRPIVRLAGQPFVPGQPVGLVNPGCNCWANSMLQFIMNVPRYKQAILTNCNDTRLADALRSYEESSVEKERVSEKVDTQTIRTELHSWEVEGGSVNPIAASYNQQEDVAGGFNLFFDKMQLNSLANISLYEDGHAGALNIDPLGELIILPFQEKDIEVSTEYNFLDLMENLHTENFELINNETKELRKLKKVINFSEIPDDFSIMLGRFKINSWGSPTLKINAPVIFDEFFEMPTEFLSSSASSSNPARFLCDCFIEHRGETPRSGHYVTYIKNDAGYWECNDRNITKIKKSRYLEKMQLGYVFHFNKIEE
jgi:Ubiquitin carboxyl-terminal hydrolase